MNSIKRTLAAIACGFTLCLAFNQAVAADGTTEKRYPLPGHGYLQLNVPAGWKERLTQPSKPVPPIIDFVADQKGKPFIVTVAPSWQTRGNGTQPDKEALRKSVEYSGRGMLPISKEKEIKVVELDGASGPGYYFSVTDNAPKPGDYKFMTKGALRVGELTVAFTILTNEGQEQVVRDALAMLKSAVQGKP